MGENWVRLMKVHFEEEKPTYIRFEGNDMFVSVDSVYWIYYGTLDEDGKRDENKMSNM